MLDYNFWSFKYNLWNEDYKNFDYIKQSYKRRRNNPMERNDIGYHVFSGAMYSSKKSMSDWVEDVSKEPGLKKCDMFFIRWII